MRRMVLGLFLMILMAMQSHVYSVPSVRGTDTTVEVSPNIITSKGSHFIVNLTINRVSDLSCCEIGIEFRKIIRCVDVIENKEAFPNLFLSFNRSSSYRFYRICLVSGLTFASITSESVRVATLNFTTDYCGLTNVTIYHSLLLDTNGNGIPHQKRDCTVQVVGGLATYFLNVRGFSGGKLNLTSGNYTCFDGQILTIQATEREKAFTYFLLDGVENASNPIKISMTSDHDLTAVFHLPQVTFYSSVSSVFVQVGGKQGTTNSSGFYTTSLARGNYTVKATKANYYDYVQSINLLDNTVINMSMYPIIYYGRDISSVGILTSMSGNVYDFGIPELYYLDMNKLVYCVPYSGETGWIDLGLRYGTPYPRIELNAEHLQTIYFNLTLLWQNWTGEDADYLIQTYGFFGIRLDTTDDLTIVFCCPRIPRSVWKTTMTSATSLFSEWTYGDGNVTMALTRTKSTFSVLFFSPPIGDLDHDGKVDLKDCYAIARAYGSWSGRPDWNSTYDLNQDGKVDLRDYYIVCKNFGKTYP